MPLKWKPDRETGTKREQRFRLERQRIRKTFAENMQRAEDLYHVYYSAADVGTVDTGDLEQKFVEWAFGKYRHEKFKEPLRKEHIEMTENWREIVVTTEACKAATAGRMEANRVKRHMRKAAAICNRFVG
jgi:hypothetical protein